MTTKKLLIDPAPLIDYFSGGDEVKSMAESASDERFVMALKNAPTVDAVEVVRCKDCFHLKGRVCCNPSAGMWVGVELKDNDFCSYGERKTDG